MRATCPAHLILLDLMCLMMFGISTKYEAPHCATSSVLLLLSQAQMMNNWQLILPIWTVINNYLNTLHISTVLVSSTGILCRRTFLIRRIYNCGFQIRADDSGGKHLWNLGLLRDYTAVYPRNLSSSYSLPWESEISQKICQLLAAVQRHILTPSTRTRT
jgi:hypothetical protein